MKDARVDFRANPRLIPDDVRLRFGGGDDAQLVWSTADAGNHSLVLALGDSNQALHVTDAGAVATDWNVAADTHPALYLHSNTTPATDYLKIGGHDGTSATIDLVGGTTLKIAFDGSAEVEISATALSPSSDGGNALGTTSLGWNGLHLNTGTAINWENGDVTLTHAAGKVTWGGDGAVEIDFANHEMTNVDINSGAIDGTVIGAASVAAGSFAAVVGATGTFSDILKSDDTTGSNSTTSGSGQFAGGIGVAGNGYFGGQQLNVISSQSGGSTNLKVQNSNNDASSHAKLTIMTGGEDSSSDAYIEFTFNFGTDVDWRVGMDNSNTDAFVWSDGVALGTNDRMRLAKATGVLSVDGDGGGSDDPVALFDDDDDAELALRFAYAHPAAPAIGVVTMEQWRANRELMVEKGLAEWAEQSEGRDRLMYNVQPMMRMLAGGIYQNREALVQEVASLREEMGVMERQLKAIGA